MIVIGTVRPRRPRPRSERLWPTFGLCFAGAAAGLPFALVWPPLGIAVAVAVTAAWWAGRWHREHPPR